MSTVNTIACATEICTEENVIKRGVARTIYLKWMYTTDKPPYTETQLFIMALLIEGKPLTIGEIQRWILENIGYYKDLAFRFVDAATELESRGLTGLPGRAVKAFYRNLREVPLQFELPLEVLPGPPVRFAMGTVNAERMLWSMLRKDRDWETWSIPFFDLSAELRNTIYEMMFQYPESGMMLKSTSNVATLATRSMDEAVSRYNEAAWNLATRPLKEVLAPLLVSRQFRREALPFFYGLNHFVFRDTVEMLSTLSKMPDEHFKHVTHISFDLPKYDPRGELYISRYYKQSYELLRMLDSLRRLDVYLDETEWVAKSSKDSRGRPKLKMTGISSLGLIRGLDQVNFVGCPTLAERFAAKMVLPKTDNAEVPKKRSATEGDDEEQNEIAETKKKRTKKNAGPRWFPGC